MNKNVSFKTYYYKLLNSYGELFKIQMEPQVKNSLRNNNISLNTKSIEYNFNNDNINNLNFNNLNIPLLNSIKYDKIDNQSRYKKIYKYPNDFKETKNIADILIIDFTNNNVDKLNITSLQNIINVLLTYMILNKKDIIELYDECL